MAFYRLCVFWLTAFACFPALAQSTLKGTVRDAQGQAVPGAAVYVKALSKAVSTNEQGRYELQLPDGPQEIVFQCLGYHTDVQRVQLVAGQSKQLDVVLKEQVYVLQEVAVRAKNAPKEDPAYYVMRQAIKAAPYYARQLERYQALVYVKGAGHIEDLPLLLRNKIRKEAGIKEGDRLMSESVSRLTFQQPNKYTEHVLSMRSVGMDKLDEGKQGPIQFIKGSIYDFTEGFSSPLSKSAFAHYRFVHEGTFQDRGYKVHRIRLIPRHDQASVAKGYLNVLDQTWNVHSCQLRLGTIGTDIDIAITYNPVAGVENVWMPTQYVFKAAIDLMGFEGKASYVATAKDYQVKLNPKVDHRRFANPDDLLQQPQPGRQQQIAATMQRPTLSGRERNRLRRQLEEEQRLRPDTTRSEQTEVKVDSMATKRDDAFWAEMRGVPLLEEERPLLEKPTRMPVAEKSAKKKSGEADLELSVGVNSDGALAAGATVSKKDKSPSLFSKWVVKAQPQKLDSTVVLRHYGLLDNLLEHTRFSTVDGWSFAFAPQFDGGRQRRLPKAPWEEVGTPLRWMLRPWVRYAEGRNTWNGMLEGEVYYAPERYRRLSMAGGWYVNDMTAQGPGTAVNTAASLLFGRNYQKFYERAFLKLEHGTALGRNLYWQLGVQYEDRRWLDNLQRYRLPEGGYKRHYTDNAPQVEGLVDSRFPDHKAFWVNSSLRWVFLRPYRKKYNEPLLYERNPFLPQLELSYRQGIAGVLDSEVDYSLLSAEVSQTFRIRYDNRLHLHLRAGAFLGRNRLYLPDFQDFAAAQFPLYVTAPATTFRSLDYYRYATDRHFVALQAEYSMNKLLVNRFGKLHHLGFQESIFANYLQVPHALPLFEMGYGVGDPTQRFRLGVSAGIFDWSLRDPVWRLTLGIKLLD